MDNEEFDFGWFVLSVIMKNLDPEGESGMLYGMSKKLHELGLDSNKILDYHKWLYEFLKAKEQKGEMGPIKFPSISDDELSRLIRSETKEDE